MPKLITKEQVADRISVGIPPHIAHKRMAVIVHETGVSEYQWKWKLRQYRKLYMYKGEQEHDIERKG